MVLKKSKSLGNISPPMLSQDPVQKFYKKIKNLLRTGYIL
jgi:hypothetical protein